jgi:RNA polymerase sigma-70 factor, ECF subfamily
VELERVLRGAWWHAAAAVARMTGDLSLAEDAVQEACAAALEQWPRDGLPANPPGWISAVARRRAVDHLRRERTRSARERLAVQQYVAAEVDTISTIAADDQLALLFACCHPALEPTAQVCLTLRVVCGLDTASIARLLLLPQPTVAQRLVRAKRKIRDAGIRLHVPPPEEVSGRLSPVLRTIYLMFTEGHAPRTGAAVVRSELCEESVRLARALNRLMPVEPEVTGLLALILLTSSRDAARVDDCGAMVLLPDQNRTLWDRASIDEGLTLLESALTLRRPGVTSCRRRSLRVTPTRPHPTTRTGGRSQPSTANCSGSTPRR